MKVITRIIVATAFCCIAVTTFAGQTQQVAPNEVPEGITAEDWGIVQEAYLKASNTESWDGWGSSVAISGDTIVVGASGEASSATGVNGNQTDNSAYRSGAAYVFTGLGTPGSATIKGRL